MTIQDPTLGQVHKFGGTCVAAAERISAIAQLVTEDTAERKLVVVSAMGAHPSSPVKVTDLLLNMVDKAGKQDQAFLIDLAALQVHRLVPLNAQTLTLPPVPNGALSAYHDACRCLRRHYM